MFVDRTRELSRINPIMFEKLEIHLLQKYVDDVFVAGNSIRKGVRYDKSVKALIWTIEQQENDTTENSNDEQRSMGIIAEISSSILDFLTFTWDSPTCNEDGKMPLLDTKTWIGLERREKGLSLAFGNPKHHQSRRPKAGSPIPIL